MHTFDTIREFKTRNFTVRVDAVEDNDVDLSFDEDGSVQRDIEAGRLMAFSVHVTVFCRGSEVGEDWLGGCIYKTPRAFMDHVGIRHYSPVPGTVPEGGCGSYFSDMVREAISEARKTLASLGQIRIRQ